MEINTTSLAIRGETDHYYQSTLTLYNVTANHPRKFKCRAVNEVGDVAMETISFTVTSESRMGFEMNWEFYLYFFVNYDRYSSSLFN